MKSFVQVHRRKLIILLFLFMFVFGAANVKDYGLPWDERTEVTILLANAKEYVLRIFPGENKLHVLADLIYGEPISQNIERDHGIAAYYGFLPLMFLTRYEYPATMYAWHIYTYILWFSGVISLYFLLKEVYKSSVIPALGTAIFFFTPRVFADGHYNNKDIIFLVFVIITLLFAVRAMKYMRLKDLLCFSLSSGFMMNGKVLGIAIWGLTGIFVIAYFAFRKNDTLGKKIRYSLFAVFMSLLFYFLLTPASWSGPIDFLRYCIQNSASFSRWKEAIMFRGQLIHPTADGLPSSYLPQWMLMTTPVYISVLFVSSCITFIVMAAKSKWKALFSQDREFLFVLFLLSFLCPFLYAVVKSSSFVLYNGWRHMYFLYGYYLLCAMYPLDLVIENFAGNNTSKGKATLLITAFFVGVGFVSTLGDMLTNRSYEYAYFNRASRQFADLSGYDGDYWNVSVIPTLNSFADEYYDGGNPLKVALMEYAVGGQDWSTIENERIDLVQEEDADYFLFNSSVKAQLSSDMTQYEKVFSIEKFGYELTAVYTKK